MESNTFFGKERSMAQEMVIELRRTFPNKRNIFRKCVFIRVLGYGIVFKKICDVDMGSESKNSKK